MSEEQKLADLLSGATKPRGSLPEPDPTEELETVDHPEVQADGHARPAPGSVTRVNLFRHPEAHPVVLDLALLRRFGPEWYGWEPETVERRIHEDFAVKEISDLALSKIQAVKTLHLVDTFWKQWEVFVWAAMPFNGVQPDFEVMQVPTVAQCMVAVDVANQLRDDVSWSTEVQAFLEVVHRHDGIFVPQPPLDFVTIDTEGLFVDPAEVRLLWPAVVLSNKMPTAETVTSEQLRRMLSCWRVLEASRSSLRAQLPLVQHV